MKDNTIDIEAVPVEIVRCPRCGARNRLLKQERQVAYRCGGCGATLANPFVKLSRRPSSWVIGKYIGMIVVAVVVVVAVMRNTDPQPPHAPSPLFTPAPPPIVSAALPPPPETGNFAKSLENGTILTDLVETGHGKFTVQNYTDRDAVVKLVDETRRRVVVAFYVTAYNSATVDEIPDGSFAVLCGQGEDWDDLRKDFKRKKSFGQFKPDMDFTPKIEQTERQIIRRYRSNSLELAPSVDGNITNSDISEKAFRQY